MEKTEIDGLDIYGDGPEREKLEVYIKENSYLDGRVRFCGRTDELAQRLDKPYDGILGMGRVALAAQAMNLPALLLSANGIVAAIDEGNLYQLSRENFSGRGEVVLSDEETIDLIDDIYQNPQNYQNRETIVKEFEESIIWEDYTKRISELVAKGKAVPCHHSLMVQLHYVLCNISSQGPWSTDAELFDKIANAFQPELGWRILHVESIKRFQALNGDLQKTRDDLRSLSVDIKRMEDMINELIMSKNGSVRERLKRLRDRIVQKNHGG
jgi:hypothetical protein